MGKEERHRLYRSEGRGGSWSLISNYIDLVIHTMGAYI
jgi:hypothetical protein